MANLLSMMKEAASMQKQMKRVQKELARKTVEFSGPGDLVKVVARGDMTIDKITLSPEALASADADKLGKQLTSAVNGALEKAKREAGQEMARITGGMGLPNMG